MSAKDFNTDLFDGLRDNEEILSVWRSNPVVMFKRGLLLIIIGLILAASFLLFGASLVTSLVLGATLILSPLIAGYAYYLWSRNAYVLTNERLVDINSKQLFHRSVSEIPMDIIQDVTYEVRGPIQQLLNIGSVIVQTSSWTEVELVTVTDPQAIQQVILKAAKEFRRANGITG